MKNRILAYADRKYGKGHKYTVVNTTECNCAVWQIQIDEGKESSEYVRVSAKGRIMPCLANGEYRRK